MYMKSVAMAGDEKCLIFDQHINKIIYKFNPNEC